jgi:polyisoprenoid-binding protein YceI
VRTLFILAVIVSASTAPGPGHAAAWILDPGHAQTVGFRSKAPLETFEGSTHRVTGHVTLDPAAIGDSLEIEVRVDLASLDTGLAMRDRNMRENHLHTDRFPYATFHAGIVTDGAGTDLRDGEPHDIALSGTLDLHGVKRPVSVSLTVRLGAEGDAAPDERHEPRLRITTRFPVALADYDIPRPRFLFAKLAEVQLVSVDLVADPATDAFRSDAPLPPPGGKRASGAN